MSRSAVLVKIWALKLRAIMLLLSLDFVNSTLRSSISRFKSLITSLKYSVSPIINSSGSMKLIRLSLAVALDSLRTVSSIPLSVGV